MDNPNVTKLIRDLNAQVQAAQEAYYNGAPAMTDAEYDVLEAKLRAVVQTSPWLANEAPALKKVGAAKASGRIAHAKPMRSIENKYELAGLQEFLNTLPAGTMAYYEPKYDGLSLSLIYENGKLVQALTRGTGDEGESCLEQVRQITSIPKEIAQTLPQNVNIRGEAVITTDQLDRINTAARAAGTKEYASTRNLASGTLKLKDVREVSSRGMKFCPFEILGDDSVLPDSSHERVAMFSSMFGHTFHTVWPDTLGLQAGLNLALENNDEIRKQEGLECDGVVLKVDSHKLRRELGIGDKYTKYQVCFKQQSAAGTTYLREVVWQIGRQGKLTPVGTCEPVCLAGAEGTRTTLNNITWIEAMGLSIDCKVEMLRSGDVIPIITKVLDYGNSPIEVPQHCPECKTFLTEYKDETSGVTTQWCENAHCPGRIRDTFTFVASREMLEIDGLGPELATKIVGGGHARDLGELFLFANEATEQIAQHGQAAFDKSIQKQGMSAAAINKMVASMTAAKTADWSVWLAALGIPTIGKTHGKTLARVLSLESNSMKDLPGLLGAAAQMDIEGLGLSKKDELTRWAMNSDNVALCLALHSAGIRPASVVTLNASGVQPLAGLTFCITGEFEEERESLIKKLESLGAVSKSGVSAKCQLLIVGTAAGKSKLAKAASLGVKQVGKDWLVKTLTDNSIDMVGNRKFVVEEA